MADERIGHDFKRQRGKRLIVTRAAHQRLFAVKRDAVNRRHVQRRRQIIDNGIEQRLNAFVLEGRACQHGYQLERNRRAAHRGAKLRGGQRLSLEILLEHGIVVLGDIFNNLFALRAVEGFVDRGNFQCGGDVRASGNESRIPQLRDFKDLEFRAQSFFEPDDHFFFDEIDAADEETFFAERELQGNRAGGQALTHGLNTMIEIGAGAVHLVDESDARHVILIGLTPNSFRLRLHAGDRVKNGHSAIEHAQRAFDFDGEIHVAGRIDNIDLVFDCVALPGSDRGGRSDGDAALALLLHPIHGGGAFIDFTDFVGHAGVEQNAFSRSGLTRIDVRHDSDVARVFEIWIVSHSVTLLD